MGKSRGLRAVFGSALHGNEALLSGGIRRMSSVERRRAHGEMQSGGSSRENISASHFDA
jgi:hypothetical protein